MDSVFRAALIDYSISEYPALFTDSPPVPPQLIKQAVPEIHEEGDEVPFGSFNR